MNARQASPDTMSAKPRSRIPLRGTEDEHLYELLRPGSVGIRARMFRAVHHFMVVAGIAVMLADTVQPWWVVYGTIFANIFHLISVFFIAEYLLRFINARAIPGTENYSAWRTRLDWAMSVEGVDFLGALPGIRRELLGRQPDLARVIYDAEHQRLGAGGAQRREREVARAFGCSG